MAGRMFFRFTALLLIYFQLWGVDAGTFVVVVPERETVSCLSPALRIGAPDLARSAAARYAEEQATMAIPDTTNNRKKFGAGKFYLKRAELFTPAIQAALWNFVKSELASHTIAHPGDSGFINIAFLRSNTNIHDPSYALYEQMMKAAKDRGGLRREIQSVLIGKESPDQRIGEDKAIIIQRIETLTGKRPRTDEQINQLLAQYYDAKIQSEFGKLLELAIKARVAHPAYFMVSYSRGKKIEINFEVRVESVKGIFQASLASEIIISTYRKPQQLELFPNVGPPIVPVKPAARQGVAGIAASI